MSYLYFQTVSEMSVGVLSDDFQWIDYGHTKHVRPSQIIHVELERILTKNSLELLDLNGVFACYGPGSYTGIRLSFGIAEILKLFSVPTFPFYLHEVPSYNGVKSGSFVSHAFKGENFVYSWDEAKSSINLVKGDYKSGEYFTIEKTFEMIAENSKNVFPRIFAQEISREPFYYRKVEDEYKLRKRGE